MEAPHWLGILLLICASTGAYGSCVYNNKQYEERELATAVDGCNTCTCMSGTMACTQRTCACSYEGQTYFDGAHFKQKLGCNTCNCLAGSISCTETYCDEMGKHANTPCVVDRVQYQQGQAFRDANNCRCRCMALGAVGCDLTDCGAGNAYGTCEYNGQVYATGDAFPSSDGCDACFCAENGAVGCSKLQTCPGQCLHGGVYYKEGESFKDDCKTCTCQSNNDVICTDMDCNVCTYSGATYAAGESFVTDCENCTCMGNNTTKCTMMEACMTKCTHHTQIYYVGETFNDGCNECACAENGEFQCTERFCPDGTKAKCQYNGREYEEGDVFPQTNSCNECFCGANGQVGCTENECNPGGCFYHGQSLHFLDQIESIDGCNKCTCLFDGMVSCTNKSCEGGQGEGSHVCMYDYNVYAIGDRFMDKADCNECMCHELGRISCTEKACQIQTALNQDCLFEEDMIVRAGDKLKSFGGCPCTCGKYGAIACNFAQCESCQDDPLCASSAANLLVAVNIVTTILVAVLMSLTI